MLYVTCYCKIFILNKKRATTIYGFFQFSGTVSFRFTRFLNKNLAYRKQVVDRKINDLCYCAEEKLRNCTISVCTKNSTLPCFHWLNCMIIFVKLL